ncbi:ParB/RepB/Spo0J family partition protein [Patescibacteria group bacterium]|nr:ParB/RepB/Spo0J family partition protein [Patescibacteria group bacterium]
MAFQGDSIFWVEVEKIVPNPFQPRREFDEEKLKELAESVRMYGILQPLTVTRREIQNDDGSFRSEYELIAGERRLRASKLAGIAQVPVIIREGEQSEQEKLELAIIENLQREDLNAVDRAIAFRQLADVFGLSHMQVAKKMGRSREYVSNSIRLLALPDYMLSALRTGDVSEGHCRALLMLNDRPEEQDTVFRELLLKKLSVREVERIARHIATEKIRKKGEYDADLVEMEKKFTETLGTRVSITKTEFGGRLSIDYFTQEELEEILEGMLRESKKTSIPNVPAIAPVMALGAVAVPGELGNPRADELAILTDRTGLELVPEHKPAESIVIPTPTPTSVPTPVTVDAPVIVSTVPEPVVPTPHVPEPAPEVVSTYVPPVQEVPTKQEPADSQNSLRDQLASLLGSNISHVPAPAVPQMDETSVPAPISTPIIPPQVSEPSVPMPVVPPAQTTSDDSNLYSVRDFTI